MVKILERRKAVPRFGVRPDNGYIEHCSMSSDILGEARDFSVYLPAGYDEADKSYPVVYLFHPGGGTNTMWVSMGYLPQIIDDAVRSGMVPPMIVVMPSGAGEGEYHMGHHMGFFSVPGWDYEGYIINELIPLIETSYRCLTDRGHRAIIGVSMGGASAISYAQKHPELFSSAGSISGLLGHPETSQLSATDAAYAASLVANNPTAYVENAADDGIDKLRMVRWYADCADNDYVVEGNIVFFQAMKRRGIDMDYRMRSGVHGWYYWITGIAPVFRFVSAVF